MTPQITRSGRSLVTLALLTAVACSGCGTQQYEERLKQTELYFAYRQRVDEALEKITWQSAQFDVEFRPPIGFQEIPAPGPEEGHDARQPTFINTRLPGLIGAWQGQVRIDVAGIEATELRAFVFMCTNHSRFLELDDENPAGLFREDIVERLGPALGFDPPSQTPWTWEPVRAPRGTAYVPRKSYEWILLDKVPCNIDNQNIEMDFKIYRYDEGQIQLAVISVIPHSEMLDPRERIEQRMEYAMEQLQMGSEVPRKTGAVQSSGGGF